jgi:hypothetical protein
VLQLRAGAESANPQTTIDFDLAMFANYVGNIKFLMRGVFQSIMFRLFRSERAVIQKFKSALKMQAFSR